MRPGGNFEGRSILNVPRPLDEAAGALGLIPPALRATIDAAREVLYRERAKRPPPLRDEKILTAWNGLMISAHARAAMTLGEVFMTSDDHEALLGREKPSYDGAEPSGNSIAVLNLLRLHEPTTDDRYRRPAARTLEAFATVFERAPSALSEMFLAVDFMTDMPKQIIIVTPASSPARRRSRCSPSCAARSCRTAWSPW
ncbi:MAG: thioredoxin domain-containing protein [Acidobacteria bacterium]|nr:thioredoxin domain-containing protein [Acidobacteriota bacterium]